MGFIQQAIQLAPLVTGAIFGTREAVKGVDQITGAKASREQQEQILKDEAAKQDRLRAEEQKKIDDFALKEKKRKENEINMAMARRAATKKAAESTGNRQTALTNPLGSDYSGERRRILGA